MLINNFNKWQTKLLAQFGLHFNVVESSSTQHGMKIPANFIDCQNHFQFFLNLQKKPKVSEWETEYTIVDASELLAKVFVFFFCYFVSSLYLQFINTIYLFFGILFLSSKTRKVSKYKKKENEAKER